MEVTQHLQFPITEPSHVGDARRQTVSLAHNLGFDDVGAGKIALVLTEMASNLLKHAVGGGELLVNVITKQDIAGIELISLDKGPGIANVAASLQDGYSTVGTSGTGLGAIQRNANQFDVYSIVGKGSAFLAQWWKNPLFEENISTLESGGVCVPIKGENVSGDAWAVHHEPLRSIIIAADGLGHGPDAAAAANAAIAAFGRNTHRAPKDLLEIVHLALKGTRGAAVAISEIDRERETIRYTGLGNIVGLVMNYQQDTQRMVSMNGTVGQGTPHMQEFMYKWSKASTLVMHSDGCHTHWDLVQYPGLLTRQTSLISSVIYRDFNRGRDDASVVVVRDPR